MNTWIRRFLVASLLWATPCCIAQEYSIVDLGTLGGDYSEAKGVNNRGEVAGNSFLSGGQQRAFLYKNGALIDLGTLGGNFSQADAINNAGEVTGASTRTDGELQAYLYSGGTMSDIGVLTGKDRTEGKAINGATTVVGVTGIFHFRGFLYSNGSISSLPHGSQFDRLEPAGINASGMIAGTGIKGQTGGPVYRQHAFRLSGGTVTDLGALLSHGFGVSIGYAINASGDVCGMIAGNPGYHAAMWTGNTIHDLGHLPHLPGSYALAIDTYGECTGTSESSTRSGAFLHNSVIGLKDLNQEIATNSGWTLEGATAISDSGYIAGQGFHTGFGPHAFLLKPNHVLILKKYVFALEEGDPGCIQCGEVLDPQARELPDSLEGLTGEQRRQLAALVTQMSGELEQLGRRGDISAAQARLMVHKAQLLLNVLE